MVTRLSKLPRGNKKLMWTVTGIRPCTEAKIDPGVSELPWGNEMSRDHVNRPLETVELHPAFKWQLWQLSWKRLRFQGEVGYWIWQKFIQHKINLYEIPLFAKGAIEFERAVHQLCFKDTTLRRLWQRFLEYQRFLLHWRFLFPKSSWRILPMSTMGCLWQEKFLKLINSATCTEIFRWS